MDQVENVTLVDIPDLQAQVEALQHQLDVPPATDAQALVSVLHERDDVKTGIQTLQDLVIGKLLWNLCNCLPSSELRAEMRALRENTQAQMAAELEAFKAARQAALETINAQVAQLYNTGVSAQSPGPSASLKRKHSDDEGEDEIMSEVVSRAGPVRLDIGVGVGEQAVAMMDEQTASPSSPNDTNNTRDVPSPPKRQRRLASIAVHTATAVTLGAVATWSALAFS